MLSKALTITAVFTLFLLPNLRGQLFTPNPPTNLSVDSYTDSSVSLEWQDNASGEDFFIVERSTEVANNWVELIAIDGVDIESYTDNSVLPNTRYYYRVKARNITIWGATADSDYSNVTNVTTFGPPEAPNNLTGNPLSQTTIELVWEYTADNADEFSIERSSNGIFYSEIAKVNSTVKQANNIDLSSNTGYFYRVVASNTWGDSPYSNTINATTFQYPPTIADIADPNPIFENSGMQTINLSNITAGGTEIQDLTVTATSNNPALIPTPVIQYTSPDNTGKLTFQPNADQFGTATITVTVKDSGPNTPSQNVNEYSTSFDIVVNETAPDLRLGETVIADLICQGEPFSVETTVYNIGTKGSETTTMGIYLSIGNNKFDNTDIFLGSNEIPALAPGDAMPLSFQSSINQALEEGPFYIVLFIDPDNTVEEGSEINNTSNEVFEFCLPDLTIENANTDNALFFRGQEMNVTYDISNIGQFNAGEHKISYYFSSTDQTQNDQQLLSSTTIDLLEKENSLSLETNLIIPDSTADGTYFISFRIDSDNTVYELNEDNNTTSIEVIVKNLAELSAIVNVNPSIVGFGQSVEVTSTFSNLGIVDAIESTVAYYLSKDSTFSKDDILFPTISNLDSMKIGIEQVTIEEFIIPDNIEEGLYQIIVVVDSENVIEEYDEINNTVPFQITILADLPPIVIATDFPEWAVEGTNSLIQVEATDDVLIDEVYIKYRGIRSIQWDSTQVFRKFEGQDIYEVAIPSAFFDEMGLEYYFIVYDDVGLSDRSEVGHTYIEYPDQGMNIPGMKFGENTSDYVMISIPLSLDNKSFVSVLEDDLGEYNIKNWRLFQYEDQKVQEFKVGFEEVEIGKGYWIIAKDQQSIDTGSGRTVKKNQSELFEIELQPGWNQIGNPYNFEMKWSRVLAENGFPTSVSGDIQIYDHGFNTTDVLAPFQGGFVNSSSAITLKIPIARSDANNPITSRLASNNSEDDWQIQLAIENSQVKHRIFGFGMNNLAENGIDKLDGKQLPAFSFLSDLGLKFKSEENQSIEFAKSIVAVQSNYKWQFEVENNSDEKYIYLSWGDISDMDMDENLILFNKATTQKIDMKGQSGIWINSEESHDFTILYGDDTFIDENTQIASIILGNGYPNPFSKSAIIPLALPKNRRNYEVTLDIYNSIGQHIKTLAKGPFEAGLHELIWSGENAKGTKVNAGIYFYKLQVINDENHKKTSLTGRLIHQ